jgi:hypothetical protein
MTFFGRHKSHQTPPHANHAAHDLTVERRRRYVDTRWRPEAFGEPVRREDTERYFMERGELQGGLFE